MSEAELIATFQGYLSETTQLVFGYISVMSGFLIMSYLVAHKIPRSLAAIVLGLFSAVSAVLMFRIFLNRTDTRSIVAYILEQKELGNFDLPWFGSNPWWAVEMLTYFEIAATLGGFFGCVAFFLYKRRSIHDDA